MSHSPSNSKFDPLGSRDNGGGYHRPSPPRPRHPRRRATTHEPSALHSYIVATKISLPERSGDDCDFEVMSCGTAETLPRDNRSRPRRRGASLDGSGFLPSASSDSDARRRECDDEYGAFVELAPPEPAPAARYDESGVFGQPFVDTAGSGIFWNDIDGSYYDITSESGASSPPASCREKGRLRGSTPHVVRRCARAVAGILVLAAFVVYIAFEVDLESISMDDNLLGRFFGNDLPGGTEEETASELRSRKLHREYFPVKKQIPVPQEDQDKKSPQGRTRGKRTQPSGS